MSEQPRHLISILKVDVPILHASDQVRPVALPSRTAARTPTATASMTVSALSPKRRGGARRAAASAAREGTLHSRGGSIAALTS